MRVRSRVGQVELPAEVTADMMPGVVCMPHGYGHTRPGIRLDRWQQQHAGVSINDLTDETKMDELTGNAVLNGVPVWVEVPVHIGSRSGGNYFILNCLLPYMTWYEDEVRLLEQKINVAAPKLTTGWCFTAVPPSAFGKR